MFIRKEIESLGENLQIRKSVEYSLMKTSTYIPLSSKANWSQYFFFFFSEYN